MKNNQKVLIGIAVIMTIVVTIIVLIGGKLYLDKNALDKEMLAVVDSKEAKEVYEETLINNDPNAFTKEGIIQSYKIDHDSVEHNPMGGIMLNLIVNDNKELYVHVTLEKEYDGSLGNSSGGTSSELDDMLTGVDIDGN